MSLKIKYSFILLLIAVLSVGFYFNTKKKHKEYPTFSVNIKHVGDALLPDEQKLFDQITDDNKHFISSLSPENKILFDSIEKKVKDSVITNPRLRINYKKFLDKEEYEIVKLVRKHKKQMREKHKTDKKTFAQMMKKLTQEQSMQIMMYIK